MTCKRGYDMQFSCKFDKNRLINVKQDIFMLRTTNLQTYGWVKAHVAMHACKHRSVEAIEVANNALSPIKTYFYKL